MKRTLWQRLRAIGQYIPGWSRALRAARLCIPGFRHLSQTSIAVAITYYAAALAVTVAAWPWSLALLAAPFFFFALSDLSHARSRRAIITAGISAALLLLGISLGLGAEGYRLKTIPDHPVLAQSTDATPVVSHTLVTPTPDAPTADPQSLLFVASKGGKVFHKPDCASAKNIKPENRVQFVNRAAAIAAGLKPCQKCKP